MNQAGRACQLRYLKVMGTRIVLSRANFAWFIIVTVIGALAVGLVWNAGQSVREAERANQNALRAEREANKGRKGR